MKMSSILLATLIFLNVSCAQDTSKKNNESPNENIKSEIMPVQHTDEEWKKILSPEQYDVLRLKGTERPFTGKYNVHSEEGVYTCAACNAELFTSDMKFESSCGWPSFDEEIAGGKVIKKEDRSLGMVRTEILCANCGSHLGHIFNDGPTETGMRYCVNSLSLDFKKQEIKKEEEKK